MTVILPIKNEPFSRIKNVLQSLDYQTAQADEIIIINTGSNKLDLTKFNKFRCFQKIKLHQKINCYPGAARNYGVSVAKNNIIGFLDANTYPCKNWLEDSLNILAKDNKKIVIGKTFFKANTYFQKLVRACSYGRIAHETVPGTLLTKKNAQEIKFNEKVRAGEDIDWKNKIRWNVK